MNKHYRTVQCRLYVYMFFIGNYLSSGSPTEFQFLFCLLKITQIFFRWKLNEWKILNFGTLKKTRNSLDITTQKMKFSIKDFFSKCDQIRRKLPIWSYLLKKCLMENFIFCAVYATSRVTRNFLSCLISSHPGV